MAEESSEPEKPKFCAVTQAPNGSLRITLTQTAIDALTLASMGAGFTAKEATDLAMVKQLATSVEGERD
jgi:Cu/Ag efflux protein CusF